MKISHPLRRLIRRFLMCGFLAGSAILPILATERNPDEPWVWVPATFTKFEYFIPMRDGVKLFTRVYVPKDDSVRYPILITRTPYALKPYGVDNYGEPYPSLKTLVKDMFIFVAQDVRGRFASEGTYQHMRPFNPAKGPKDTDESSDAWDTIDWLVKHVPNNNGNVGMLGISYPGFYTSMAMIDSHPALKAVSPQAPIADWFMGDDIHHNGALFLSQNFSAFHWIERPGDDPLREDVKRFNFKNPDGYDFHLRLGSAGNAESVHFKGQVPVWKDFLDHPNYDGFWQARNIRPHLRNVHCAVLTVGGWFDGENLFGALETYRSTERQNPGITNLLVMGPWSHGQWSGDDGDRLGDVVFQAKTGEYFREKIELPFFRRFLKGDTNSPLTEAHLFETGTHRWRRFNEWPPRNTQSKTLFFHASGKLAFAPPTEGSNAFDEYVSDPAKPVPFTMRVTTDYARRYPVEDQRFAASRTDVLVYETELLEEDITFAGPLTAALNVSTSGTDSDWVVKLIDVYALDFPNPDPNPKGVVMGGYQQLVRGDVMRGRFRKSFEKPQAMEPGQVTKIEFTMPDILHTFRRGHRIMVQVQSAWFPLVDRNPQTFVPNIAYAKPEDFRKATQRVYRSANSPSSLTVGVLPPVEPTGPE